VRTYVTSLDTNFIVPTSVMLVSLNNSLNVASKCVVLTSWQDFQEVKNALTNLSLCNLELRFISIPESKFDESLTMQGILHFSNAAILRLFASTSIDNSVDSIVYLDGDVMIRKPLDNNTFPTEIFSAMIELKPTRQVHYVSNYFNSGVFTTQLSFWRKNDVEKKLIDFLKKTPTSVYKDQDALNFVFAETNTEPLSDSLNFIIQDHNFRSLKKADPIIVHFAGPLKPWKLSTPNSKYVREWRTLAKELDVRVSEDDVIKQYAKRFGYSIQLHKLVRIVKTIMLGISLK
jgi:lipopolysaccharide biosynthesis glycosyltransferase